MKAAPPGGIRGKVLSEVGESGSAVGDSLHNLGLGRRASSYVQLTILDLRQLAHGSIRSQRILRVLHWMHESAGRFRRLGSVGVAGVAGDAADAAGAGADAGADVEESDAGAGVGAGTNVAVVVSISTSMCAAALRLPAVLIGVGPWTEGVTVTEKGGNKSGTNEDARCTAAPACLSFVDDAKRNGTKQPENPEMGQRASSSRQEGAPTCLSPLPA